MTTPIHISDEVREAATQAWVRALKERLNAHDIDYLAAARNAAVTVAYEAGYQQARADEMAGD